MAGNKLRRDRDSCDSATSSSGIKSNSDESNEKLKNRKNPGHLSDSDSSSSTEKPSKTLVSLNEFRRKYKKESSQHVSHSTTNQHGESEDDATLNEIGKFDESYVYEKENDFLRLVWWFMSWAAFSPIGRRCNMIKSNWD